MTTMKTDPGVAELLEAATAGLSPAVKLRLAAKSLDEGLVHVALILTTMVAVVLGADRSLYGRVLVVTPSGLPGSERLRLAADHLEKGVLDVALCLATETVNELADAAFDAQVARIRAAAACQN